jgi:hypothetical protein
MVRRPAIAPEEMLMPDPTPTAAAGQAQADGQWRFDELSALFINCTLKRSPELSHTQGLIDLSRGIMEKHGVAVSVLRAVDHQIATASGRT